MCKCKSIKKILGCKKEVGLFEYYYCCAYCEHLIECESYCIVVSKKLNITNRARATECFWFTTS